jgi:hypothetical protein
MKRVTVVWLIFVFLAGAGGFAISMSHNRPRLAVNPYSLDVFLKGPDSSDPTIDDCNSDGNPDTNWDILNCRFDQYKDVEKTPAKIEDWRIWDKNSSGENKIAKVHYNTVTDEIVIFCEKKKCEAQ